MVDSTPLKRSILWIDGVGAWLICTGTRISIGQATAVGGPVDVPLVADVSRIHATLLRDDEAYLLETNRAVAVNGRSITKSVLWSGDRIALGSCQMIFTLPVPGCLSAKLVIDGGRRLPMAVDGVLLMADMLVLGPGEQVHVAMPELSQPLYLFRQNDRLGIRWQGKFEVDGQGYNDRALLSPDCYVRSAGFSMGLESIR